MNWEYIGVYRDKGFPKFWGVPAKRAILFGGLYWGPPLQGNHHTVSTH